MSRQSDIWEYLQGERTGKRANRFEREMLSDPFLYEAVEGLTTVKADHEKIVQQLQKRMKKREGNKTVRLYRWGAAASLLLLAGLAVILMNRSALRQQEVVVAEMDKSEPIIRPDSLQLMAAQLDERGVTDTVTLPVRKIIGKIAGKEQVFYRQVQAVEDMDSESDESGSADVLSEPVAMAVTNEAARQAFDSCVLNPAALRRKQPITGYAVTLPKADTQKKDKKKKNDADAVGTKSVYLDSLMLEKNTRKERRTRIVQTKSRGAGERKFRQEVVIDHAGWMKEFNRYVADSLRYPEDARLEKLQGEIQLTVRLNRKGLPARIKLIQRLSPSCNREAIRLVEEYPGKWENTEKEILLTIPFKLPVTE
jgi:hypothetical protein